MPNTIEVTSYTTIVVHVMGDIKVTPPTETEVTAPPSTKLSIHTN